MIAKGLDFPNVTLVGVLNADTALNLPDFRSSERTFQLLTQVAGRAGRAEKAGQVLIQSYNPQHYAIRFAKEQDYEVFMPMKWASDVSWVIHLIISLLELPCLIGKKKRFLDVLIKSWKYCGQVCRILV